MGIVDCEGIERSAKVNSSRIALRFIQGCIAMWDFSWIDRRWEGAGYEN